MACEELSSIFDINTQHTRLAKETNNNNNNNNNNAFYIKAPFKALKDTAHKNNSTTNRRQFSANDDKCVFRRDLKVETVSEVRMSTGREFWRLGADLLKVHDPMVVRLAYGAKNWILEEDLRVREGMFLWICSGRYDCARLLIILKVRNRIFKSMRELLGRLSSCCRAAAEFFVQQREFW